MGRSATTLEISPCSKMGISLFFFFMNFFAEIGGSQDDCKVSRCGGHGPAIRFPFRLKHQPEHCGYPGFELSCSENKLTILELPYSAKLLVKKIDYKSQSIIVRDPNSCLQNLNLSASALQFTDAENYTFFKCSENKTEYLRYFPCSFLPNNAPVYALPSIEPLRYYNLSSCRKIFEVSLPYNFGAEYYFRAESYYFLNWSKPMSGSCEAEGGKCKLKKSNSTDPEIECIHEPRKGASEKLMVIGVIFGFFLLFLVVILLYNVYSHDKLEREHRMKIKNFLEDYKALNPSRYSYADIKKITNQFKDKLGQGGYGTVYRGKLSKEVFVAVKILNDSKGNGEEFINEVGTMGRIHHVNVVRLVGFCADGCKRALIYEFLPNESLEKFILSASVKNHSCWQKLQDIAIGIAKGIEYLHQGCEQRILHFDIKPHNILLDHNFNPKISDFGLAKLCSKEQSAISMTAARGTMGYIAPEVLSRNFGSVSYKSDVYSFGMLLLEMVGGRKNIDTTVENSSQVYFPEWIYNNLGQGKDVHIRIEEEGDTEIAKKLSIVGLWCIQWYPIDRPTMKAVIRMLEGREDNLVMPGNPFASIAPTATNVRTRRRPLEKELAVISELE